MRVGIVVDHPKRDLEGAVRIAYEVTKLGGEALLIPMYTQGADVPLLGLDAIVLNYARPTNRALIETYAREGIKVFILDTEGGVLSETGANSPKAHVERLKNGDFAKSIAGYFFWGDRLKDAFAAAGLFSEATRHVTGSPRFDLAARKWRSLLRHHRSGYVLVNGNFSTVNPKYAGSVDAERKTMVAVGWAPDYVDRLFADLKWTFASFLQCVPAVAKKLPDMPFLVRPHPFEREEPYREAFSGLTNVSIDGSGSVFKVVRNATAVLHCNCGTAVEAVMLEKLPVHMKFLDTETTANHALLPAKVSYHATSVEDVVATLENLAARTAEFPFEEIYAEHIYPYYYKHDGDAGNRVAEVLMRCRTRGEAPFKRSIKAALLSGRPKPTPPQLLNGVLNLIFGSALTSELRSLLKPARRDKAFTLRDVGDYLDQLASVDAPGTAKFDVCRARNPVTVVPLSTVVVRKA